MGVWRKLRRFLFRNRIHHHSYMQALRAYKAQSKLLQEYKQIVDESNYITKTDKHGIITYVNERFEKLSGYTKAELIGQNHNIVRSPDMPTQLYRELWRDILDKKVWHGTLKNRNKAGESFFVETTIAPILDAHDNIVEFISIKTDVTKLVRHRQALQEQLHTDYLTHIPNRLKLQEDLATLDTPTIILLNISRLKEVNSLFGLSLGDEMLIYLAQQLISTCHDNTWHCYRLGGDEFALMPHTPQSIHTCVSLIENLVAHIEAHPFSYNEIRFSLELSFGIANAKTPDEKNLLLAMADTALKKAKLSHTLYALYAPEHDPQKEYEQNFTWTKKLESALQENRIVLFFQPIVSTKTGKIKKYEALMRYIETDGSVVAPMAFLHVAKRSRLYSRLSHHIITQACALFADRDEKVSINLSVEDLLSGATIEHLIHAIKTYNMQHRLVIEILESEGIDNYDRIIGVLERLKAHHIDISIDDFGTGYSNFAHVVRLPIDTLKIDGSLIRDICTNPNTQAIVASIVNFATTLRLKTVAEYVSDKAIYDMVTQLGVECVQGYYLGEPKAFETL
ncbi:MAG: hypothetical protein KU37_11810 [Sulfuricurvum sp. PC08-66]|nr:MAG: hypothetical protein KU37_11810 [Sulfuricurvum sp. PC08-66]